VCAVQPFELVQHIGYKGLLGCQTAVNQGYCYIDAGMYVVECALATLRLECYADVGRIFWVKWESVGSHDTLYSWLSGKRA
jgi:hypothetical protein